MHRTYLENRLYELIVRLQTTYYEIYDVSNVEHQIDFKALRGKDSSLLTCWLTTRWAVDSRIFQVYPRPTTNNELRVFAQKFIACIKQWMIHRVRFVQSKKARTDR